MVKTVHRDPLNVVIDQLLRHAAEVLHQHRSNDGRCIECGCDFPCRSAVLAEHNLAF